MISFSRGSGNFIEKFEHIWSDFVYLLIFKHNRSDDRHLNFHDQLKGKILRQKM
jgi:hypothetical protein